MEIKATTQDQGLSGPFPNHCAVKPAVYVVPRVKETHARCGVSTSDTAAVVRILSCLLTELSFAAFRGRWLDPMCRKPQHRALGQDSGSSHAHQSLLS